MCWQAQTQEGIESMWAGKSVLEKEREKMIYGEDGNISESIQENYEGFSDGSRAKSSKRVGTQDFGITEKMAFIGKLGVTGLGE